MAVKWAKPDSNNYAPADVYDLVQRHRRACAEADRLRVELAILRASTVRAPCSLCGRVVDVAEGDRS